MFPQRFQELPCDFDPQSHSLAISTHTLTVPWWFIQGSFVFSKTLTVVHKLQKGFIFFVNLWFVFFYLVVWFHWFCFWLDWVSLISCSLCFVVVGFFPQHRFHHKEASSSIWPCTIGACVYSWMMFSATTWIKVYCKFVRNRPLAFLWNYEMNGPKLCWI